MRQIHAQNGVAGLQHRGVRGFICLRAGVGLNVNKFSPKQRLRALARQVFHYVRELAPAVIALARVAFGILVGKHAAGGFEHRFGGEVFAGDQLEAGILPFSLALNCLKNFGVAIGERPSHPLLFVHVVVRPTILVGYTPFDTAVND